MSRHLTFTPILSANGKRIKLGKLGSCSLPDALALARQLEYLARHARGQIRNRRPSLRFTLTTPTAVSGSDG